MRHFEKQFLSYLLALGRRYLTVDREILASKRVLCTGKRQDPRHGFLTPLVSGIDYYYCLTIISNLSAYNCFNSSNINVIYLFPDFYSYVKS